MTPRLRPFRLADAAATRDVFVQAVQVGAAERYSEEERLAWMPDPAMPEGWGPWLQGHTTVVAETDGRLTGFFMVEETGYLNMAFVRPECRGDGTADALYAWILQAARARGMPALTVLASRYAEGFFRRHGWTADPDTRHHDGRPMNRPMSLRLT